MSPHKGETTENREGPVTRSQARAQDAGRRRLEVRDMPSYRAIPHRVNMPGACNQSEEDIEIELPSESALSPAPQGSSVMVAEATPQSAASTQGQSTGRNPPTSLQESRIEELSEEDD